MAFVSTLLGITQFLFAIMAGMIGIGIIIGFHELGHFLFCKLFKIRTPSFSIGFGPKLISKKLGDTEFSLSAIPVGGYVEIAGSAEVGQGEQKEAQSTDEHSFAKKPWYQKMLVMFGGIGFNILFAYIVLSLLFMIGGTNSPLLFHFNINGEISTIAPDSSAQKAGLQEHDRICGISLPSGIPSLGFESNLSNQSNRDIQPLLTAIREHPNQELMLSVDRPLFNSSNTPDAAHSSAVEHLQIPVTLGSKEVAGQTVGTLGVEFHRAPLKPAPFIQAIKNGIALTHLHIINTYYGFVHIFSKRDTSGMGGPIMIISATGQAFTKGFSFFLLLLAIISINLAILNLIPLPIFDGGQMLYYTIEAIIRRPIPVKIREYIHIGNWILLALLMLYLSFKDASRILQPQWAKVTSFFSSKSETSAPTAESVDAKKE